MQLSIVDIHWEVFPCVTGFGKAAMFPGRGKGSAELLGVDSQKQRMTAWLRLEDTSRVHLVQPLDQAGSLRTGFLNIAKEGYFTDTLDHLGQYSDTLTTKRCFFMFRQNLLCFSLCLLRVSCQWSEPGSVFFTHLLQVFIHYDEIQLNPLFSSPKR